MQQHFNFVKTSRILSCIKLKSNKNHFQKNATLKLQKFKVKMNLKNDFY